jgi:radical SAM superfamily enzyme YgiQ (UPF0313 family)
MVVEKMEKKKILLINPANRKTEVLSPPLGLAYIAAYTRKFFPNYSYKIIDFGLRTAHKREQVELIKRENPWIVGITAMTPNIHSAYKLAKIIKKELPDTLIVLGGAHISAVKTIESKDIDVAVLGEGENAFVDIIKMYKRNSEKKQMPKIYSGALLKSLDNFPAWDLLNLSDYAWFQPSKNNAQAVIYWSRGCPFNCIFCSNCVWRLKAPRVRFRSPENIVKEIRLLQTNYGVKEVYVFDDEVNTNIRWLFKVCEAIIKSGIKIAWKCQMRANKNLVSSELLAIMKKAGCWHIAWGLESGDNDVLKNIKKHVTTEEIYRALDIAKQAGITGQGLFMLGNIWRNSNGRPSGETYQDCQKTINFAKKLRDNKMLDYVQFNIATPYPGSEMWNIVHEFNLFNKSKTFDEKWDMDTHSLTFKHPILSENELLRLHNQAWKSFSLSPRLVLTHLSRIRNIGDIKNFFASARIVLNVLLTGHTRSRKL